MLAGDHTPGHSGGCVPGGRQAGEATALHCPVPTVKASLCDWALACDGDIGKADSKSDLGER